MRPALELVVRPFVVQPVTSPKQPNIATDQAAAQDNIVIDFGSASVTTWSGNYDQMVSFYYIKKPRERPKSSGDPINPFAPPAPAAPPFP